MLDAKLRPRIDPPLNRLAKQAIAYGLSANTVTVGGFVLGMLAMLAVMTGHFLTALILLGCNRIADGIDGAIARLTEPTDLGGYLDIVLDFIFYSGIVFAFAVFEPSRNALPAAFLIFAFMGTGCSFLAFAIIAAKRNIDTEVRGRKSFYYLGGLTEGTETIALFVAMCLWPTGFPYLAWAFGALCWITTATRIAMARAAFG